MPVPHCMFSAGRCVFWCPLAGAESDFCGRNGRWKGLIFRHNRVFVQNQGTVLKKSSLRGVHLGDFPSRQGENERRPISCAHSSWIKRSTLLCRKMSRVHPVVSFPLILIAMQGHQKNSNKKNRNNRKFRKPFPALIFPSHLLKCGVTQKMRRDQLMSSNFHPNFLDKNKR